MDEQQVGSAGTVTHVGDRRSERAGSSVSSQQHSAAAGADEVRARALLSRALDGERVSGASVGLSSDDAPTEGDAAPAEGDAGSSRPGPTDSPRLVLAKPAASEEEPTPGPVDEAAPDGDGSGEPEQEADRVPRWRRIVGPRAAEDFQAVFERLNPTFVPSDEVAVHRRRLRWLRARRYGVALALAVVPVPEFLPWIGPMFHGYSLAATYACVPKSLQVDVGFEPGAAAAVAFVPGLLLGRRCVRHFKVRAKVGFLLRVATFVLLIGVLEYAPVFPFTVHLLTGSAP